MSTLPAQRRGLLRPFGRDQKAGFATDSGAPLVEGRVGAIIASAGELPWKPELNAGIDKLRNVRANASLAGFAQVYVEQALTKFEPALTDVAVAASRSAASVTLAVSAHLDGREIEAEQTI